MPKLEFTAMELKNYFGTEVRYKHCFYEKSIDKRDAMLVHADGIYPCKLLDTRRPNEPLEVMEYRKQIWEPKTKPFFSKIISSLSKIRRSSDWSIRYEGEFSRVPEGETLKDYCEFYYPQFTSVTNWVFSVFLKKYLTDPNAVLFCYPKNIDALDNEFLQPIVQIIDAGNVIDYVYQDYAVLVNPSGCVFYTTKGAFPGKSFYVVTTERIIRYDQVDGRGTMSPVVDYEHGLGELPVYKIGAIIAESTEHRMLYESRISGVIPEFNEAVREYSDLQAAKVMHIYPERWEYTQHECTSCKGTGKRRNPLWFEGCDASVSSECECDNKGCHRGYVVAGPYSKIMVRPTHSIEGQGNIPMPPAGFIEKDVEIVRVQESSIDAHITHGLASINFEFLVLTPLNQSGTAKEVDKDELNNTVHSIAEDIVRNMDWIYWMIAKYRYKMLYNDEQLNEMVPKIAVPEKYDILSSTHLEAQLKNVKDSKANPVIINAIESEYANKAFSSDPTIRERIELVLSLDPLSNITEDEKMTRLSNKGITLVAYVISSNILEFVERAMEENKEFGDMTLKEQKDIVTAYAQEQIDAQDADLKVDMPDEEEIDPVTGRPVTAPVVN